MARCSSRSPAQAATMWSASTPGPTRSHSSQVSPAVPPAPTTSRRRARLRRWSPWTSRSASPRTPAEISTWQTRRTTLCAGWNQPGLSANKCQLDQRQPDHRLQHQPGGEFTATVGTDDFLVSTTCNGAHSASTTCQVVINFQPTRPGFRYSALQLKDSISGKLIRVELQGLGVGPLSLLAPGVASTRASSLRTAIAVSKTRPATPTSSSRATAPPPPMSSSIRPASVPLRSSWPRARAWLRPPPWP